MRNVVILAVLGVLGYFIFNKLFKDDNTSDGDGGHVWRTVPPDNSPPSEGWVYWHGGGYVDEDGNYNGNRPGGLGSGY